MGEWSWLLAVAGGILACVILLDVFLTVLHLDHDGPLSTAIFQGVWSSSARLAGAFPRFRRPLIALAGPLMIVGAFVSWMVLFILGFTLVYWPYLELFHADFEVYGTGFVAALYLSAGTGTVLGYGDIVPMHPVMQVLTVIQAGLGFALLTGAVTYLMNVVSGVTDRNAVALRLWAETDRTGDGTTAVLRSLAQEEVVDLRSRLQTLLHSLQSVRQKLYQFPVLDLYYRSEDPSYSPEAMAGAAAEIAIAAQVAASDPEYRRLGPVARELGMVVLDILQQTMAQHLPAAARERVRDAEPEQEDEARLARVRRVLADEIEGLEPDEADPATPEILHLVCRTRVFLEELDVYTSWQRDHPEIGPAER